MKQVALNACFAVVYFGLGWWVKPEGYKDVAFEAVEAVVACSGRPDELQKVATVAVDGLTECVAKPKCKCGDEA